MIKIKKFIVSSLDTNCYLVYSEETKTGFLIDPGSFDKKISGEIKSLGIDIKNIINTHGHIDHITGNKDFGYPALIHKEDANLLKDPVKNLSFFLGLPPPSLFPHKLLDDKELISERDITFQVVHTPGHTAGSICLLIDNKLFTGDTLFKEGVGRADLPGSDEKALFESIRKHLMSLDDDIEILPGHGPSSTIGHERRNNPFIKGIDI